MLNIFIGNNYSKDKTLKIHFGITTKFASKIRSIPSLYKIWSSVDLPGGDPYHKVIKQNNKHTLNGSLTELNFIVPPNILVSIERIVLDNNSYLKILFQNKEITKKNILFQNFIELILIFFLNEPIMTTYDSFQIISSIIEGIQLINNSIEIKLDNSIKQTISNYERCIVFGTLISREEDKIIWFDSFNSTITPLTLNS